LHCPENEKRVFRFIQCPSLGDFYDEAPITATPKKKKGRKLRGLVISPWKAVAR
jgi:hypothetical protein